MKEFSVLISSAGRRVALFRLCRKSLEKLGISGQVVAIDMSDFSSAYHSADRAFRVPPLLLTRFCRLCFRPCSRTLNRTRHSYHRTSTNTSPSGVTSKSEEKNPSSGDTSEIKKSGPCGVVPLPF